MFNLPIQIEYPVISVEDPAIDKEKSDLKKYAETLDKGCLVLTGKATEFFLRPLTAREWAKLMSKAAEVSKDEIDMEKILDASLLTLRMALVRVEGLEIGGKAVEVKRAEDGLVPEEFFKAFPFALVQELSNAVREVTALPLAYGEKSAD